MRRLARTTPLDQAKKETEGLSVFLLDIRDCRGKGMEIKPSAAMVNHNSTELFFDGASGALAANGANPGSDRCGRLAPRSRGVSVEFMKR